MNEDEIRASAQEWSSSEEQRDLVAEIDEVLAEIYSSVAAVHQLLMTSGGNTADF